MIQTLLKSVRQYKKDSILTPVYVSLEVALECLLPLVMAELIDRMTGEALGPIMRLGVALVIMAMFSLLFGFLAGKTAAVASCGFARNLRQDLFFKIQDFSGFAASGWSGAVWDCDPCLPDFPQNFPEV